MPPRTRARSVLRDLGWSSPGMGSPLSPVDDNQPSTDPPVGDPDEGSSVPPDSAAVGAPARASLAEAGAASENVPGIILRPPSEEQAGSISLLTPSRPRVVTRPLSGGSSEASPAPAPPKRRRKQAPPPDPLAQPMTGPSGITLTIPARQDIPSVMERLTSTAPPPSAHQAEDSIRTVLTGLATQLDLTDPRLLSSIKSICNQYAPDLDVDLLLSQRAQELLDPATCSLLPGFQLALTVSSVVRTIPANPILLNGHDLGFPSKVITVMKGNWATHIPLNALSTLSLLAITTSAKDDSYQNLSIGDTGSLKLLAPKLNEKDEPLMTVQDWLHAHPRLVACIRQFLPGPTDQVADMWAAHFTHIYNRVDFS